MRRSIILVVLVAGAALIASEAAMQPTPQERIGLYTLAGAAALVTGLVCWWLMRIHRRLPSLRWTILVVALTAVAIAAAVIGASAATMFLSPADARFMLGALALGSGLGSLVAFGVTGPLTQDLRRVADAAQRVADGELHISTGIDRRDEVGELARSVDRMVAQLADLEEQRDRDQAARRQLLASIGHDLRTPLASLRAALEALQDGVAPDPGRYFAAMVTDVTLLGRMVDDLFVLARLDAGDLSVERLALDLTEIVDGAVEAASPVAERAGVRITLHADGPLPASGDTLALNRVTRNLLDNAIRHSPAGGEVTVTLREADGYAEVRVEDQGPGFPPGFAELAFERFSRPDEARERQAGGAGLGLAIAKELIDAHGGRIRIEEAAGGSVTFRLPVTPEERPVTPSRQA